MAPTKLSDADKQAIAERYRQPDETTTTLATAYGVSNSTISRIVKALLPPDEYETLVQAKRANKGNSGSKAGTVKASSESSHASAARSTPKPVKKSQPSPDADAEVEADAAADHADHTDGEPAATTESSPPPPTTAKQSGKGKDTASRRRRRKSRSDSDEDDTQLDLLDDTGAADGSVTATPVDEVVDGETAATDVERAATVADEAETDEPPAADVTAADATDAEGVALPKRRRSPNRPILKSERQAVNETDEDDEDDEDDDDTYLDPDLLGDDFDDDDDDDFDDDDEDDDDSDDFDDEAAEADSTSFVQILPMDDEALPRQCYLVVDRVSELVTLPLKDFHVLGQLPETEVQERTLPIFDNHRVARRFSRRNQRVVKVPDGQMISQTLSYLELKGITRLLIDGQVYAVSSSES